MKVRFKVMGFIYTTFSDKSAPSLLEVVRIIGKYFPILEGKYLGTNSNKQVIYELHSNLKCIPDNFEEIKEKIKKQLSIYDIECEEITLTKKESDKLLVMENLLEGK